MEALEAINEGFVLYGPDGCLVVCNAVFRSFYGYSEAEVAPGVYRRALGLIDLERETVVVNSVEADYYLNRRESLVAGPPASFTVRLRDGRVLLISDRKTASGGVVSIQRDVTDLTKAEAALLNAQSELIEARDFAEASNRAKSEFLANMSHELRTPLNAILGFSQLVAQEPHGPIGEPRYKDYVNDIHQSGEHLLGIINDILDISRIEAGLTQIVEEAIDLSAATDWCLDFVRPRASEVGIELSNRIGSLPELHADPRLFRQILINLLSNSVKFTPKGGACWVSGNLDDQGQIEINLTDTGIGMSEDEIPKALERFGQIENNVLTRKYEGTGLGLPLAKSLTEIHGGTFEIMSKKGEGTSVKLRFPAERTIR